MFRFHVFSQNEPNFPLIFCRISVFLIKIVTGIKYKHTNLKMVTKEMFNPVYYLMRMGANYFNLRLQIEYWSSVMFLIDFSSQFEGMS